MYVYICIYIYIYIWMYPVLHLTVQEGVYMPLIISLLIVHIYIYTSSTAQGGGGSFKNRKPIGEIGCCEPGMAERIH